MCGIRKVAQACTGDTITVVSSKSPSAVVRAQISTDPAAAPITPTNAYEIWPHRQKELLAEVNKRRGKGHKINSHDILCIKNKFDVLANPKFACKPHKMSAPQYSVEFVDWMVGEYQKDQDFFAKLRAASRPKAK